MNLPSEHTPKEELSQAEGCTQRLRVIGILDELSEKFFPYECDFLNLDYSFWQEQARCFNPKFLFVESIWNGFQKSWRGRFTQSEKNIELRALISWCKLQRIPTVFWNKEDPVHFGTFLGVAALFDYVYTTDMDCIPLYKRLLKHNRVGLFPFATSLHLFNPVEKYNRKDAACFAGSYYAKRAERTEDFENIADVLSDLYPLDIYDRNPYPNDPSYSYPERYRGQILGTLPVEKIDIAYKGYKIGLTLNIIKKSSTMEARRVFELLGCNTLTITNTCLGIKNFYGETIIQFDEKESFLKGFTELIGNENKLNKVRLLALRKTLCENTYKERIAAVWEDISGEKATQAATTIGVFSVIQSENEMNRIVRAYRRQNYSEKKLFLFSDQAGQLDGHNGIPVYPRSQILTVLEGQCDYYAYMESAHYYGRHYLLDLALTIKYTNVSVIGKTSYYEFEAEMLNQHNPDGTYRYVSELYSDRCIFQSHLLPLIQVEVDNTIPITFENIPGFSTDPYNFCENFPGEECPDVDDIDIPIGHSMKEFYQRARELTSLTGNYSLALQMTGEMLVQKIGKLSRFMKYETHPLGYLNFYSTDNRENSLLFENVFRVDRLAEYDELYARKVVTIYVDAEFSGAVRFYVLFFSETSEFLGKYQVFRRSVTTLSVPEKAKYCSILLSISGKGYGMVKEFIVGPKILSAIDVGV
jgi:spore maturation protein CgeB